MGTPCRWAPLNYLYYSSSSKILVSRHPESSIEETLSHYCPQCLNKYVEDDVHTHRNRCPSCVECPVCSSPLTAIALAANVCCLQCGMCCWRSDSVGLVGSDQQDLASAILARERASSRDEAFQTLLMAHHAQEATLSFPPGTDTAPESMSSWTWSDVDNAQTLKSSSVAGVVDPRRQSLLGSTTQSSENPSTLDASKIAEVTVHSELTTLAQRLCCERHGSLSAHVSSLLPRRVYLRTKKMVRCRKDVMDGKMSILIQPKLYPLEGDSSHKLHQGRWWTKDSSAVHCVPSVAVTKAPTRAAVMPSMEPEPRPIVFLHVTLTNYKETDVAAGLEVLGNGEECASQAASDASGQSSDNAERHPPFVTRPKPLIPVKLSANTAGSGSDVGIFLASYEDDLLRDEHDSPDFTELAPEHASGDWGVSRAGQSHSVKVCIPLLVPTDLAENTDSTATHRELDLVMYCYDVSSGPPQDGECSVPLSKEKAVRVCMKIVVPEI